MSSQQAYPTPTVAAVADSSPLALPVLAFAATGIDYALDPDRPNLLTRLAMSYPAATIADMESSPQGFSFDNTANGAFAVVATGGLDPDVERGYIQMTPDVSTGRSWNSAVRDAERAYKTYAALLPGAGSVESQVWIAGMRVPSTVTAANYRLCSFTLSDASNATRVVRAAIRYDSGAWGIYNDSPVDNATVATTAGVVNDVVWFAFVRTGQAVRVYYNLGGGTAPPALSSFTAWTTHSGLLSSGADVAAQVGFTYETGTDTSTAFSGDILYYDDSGALPDNIATRWRRSALGVTTYLPVPACGYSQAQAEKVIAQGACSEDLTQAKIRAILTAAVNTRTDLDTDAVTFKVERASADVGYSGGSFAAAASVVVAGSGAFIRVTMKWSASGTTAGSVDLDALRRWSTA